MTTITPDHNSDVCHAASENRRMILDQLRALANQLETCEAETKHEAGMQSAACDSPCYVPCGNPDCPPCAQPVQASQGKGDTGYEAKQNQQNEARIQQYNQGLLSGVPPFASHIFQERHIKHQPSKTPLIVHPDYEAHSYRPRTPPQKSDLTQRSNSRELLSGTLLTGCDCVRRNGLQDQCKRVECRGSPECRTKPDPQCIPGLIAKGAHQEAKAYREAVKVRKEQDKTAMQVCCKCPPDCLQKGKVITAQERTGRGQFDRNLQTMETDPLRGPLMSS